MSERGVTKDRLSFLELCSVSVRTSWH
jgi:hypothetical protein